MISRGLNIIRHRRLNTPHNRELSNPDPCAAHPSLLARDHSALVADERKASSNCKRRATSHLFFPKVRDHQLA